MNREDLEILNSHLNPNIRRSTLLIKDRRKKDPEFKKRMNQSIIKYQTRKRKEDRLKLMEVLGGRLCFNRQCLVIGRCRDIRCLQIEHINDDGYLDKKRFKNIHSMITYYLKNQEEAKLKLQVLCANCNWIKRFEKSKDL